MKVIYLDFFGVLFEPREKNFDQSNAGTNLNHPLLEFIEQALKPKYTIGILSNVSRDMLHRTLQERLSLFDLLVTSFETGFIKPEKEIFNLAIEKAGVVPQEILFIDDLDTNIRSAKNLNIMTLLYTDFPSFTQEIKIYLK